MRSLFFPLLVALCVLYSLAKPVEVVQKLLVMNDRDKIIGTTYHKFQFDHSKVTVPKPPLPGIKNNHIWIFVFAYFRKHFRVSSKYRQGFKRSASSCFSCWLSKYHCDWSMDKKSRNLSMVNWFQSYSSFWGHCVCPSQWYLFLIIWIIYLDCHCWLWNVFWSIFKVRNCFYRSDNLTHSIFSQCSRICYQTC